MSGAHVIDIDQLVNSVSREQNYGHSRGEGDEHETSRPLIHKINIHIRNKYKDSFVPTMLTVGPYNHGIPSADSFKMMKYEFLDYILHLNHEKGLPDYLEAMSELDERARRFYANAICMGRNEFLKMLLLDGCFVLVFVGGAEGLNAKLQESNDYDIETYMNEESTLDDKQLQLTSCKMADQEEQQQEANPIDQLKNQDIWHDLLLFENQIPFFVIKKIHETIVGGSNTTTSELVENIMDLVEMALGCYPKAISKSNRPKEFHHLLHLCHMYLRPSSEEVERYQEVEPQFSRTFLQQGRNFISKYKVKSSQGLQATQSGNCWHWHRATEYNQAGIAFRKRTYCSENPHSLLDIVCCNGTIKIPCLTIDPIIKTLFCNLVAFEQTCPQFGSYVTTYVVFLSSLISMPDDVSLFTKNGIIVHQLNSDAEVCDLFREIREYADLAYHSDNYLKPLYTRIEAQYLSGRPMLRKFLGLISPTIHRIQSNDSVSVLPTTISQEFPV